MTIEASLRKPFTRIFSDLDTLMKKKLMSGLYL